jgi:hypothetical protein
MGIESLNHRGIESLETPTVQARCRLLAHVTLMIQSPDDSMIQFPYDLD